MVGSRVARRRPIGAGRLSLSAAHPLLYLGLGFLSDTDAVAAFVDKQALRIAPHGGRANAYWFAPASSDEDVLRLDLDYDTGRAALRWLPDGSHAVELRVAGPIVVLESSDYDVVTILAELARVSVETARRAVVEYIATGQRPTCVAWESGTPPVRTTANLRLGACVSWLSRRGGCAASEVDLAGCSVVARMYPKQKAQRGTRRHSRNSRPFSRYVGEYS